MAWILLRSGPSLAAQIFWPRWSRLARTCGLAPILRIRIANAGMGPRIRLGTGRAGAVARGAQVVPRLLRDLFGPQVARERSVDGSQVFSGWHAASAAFFGTISARQTFTLLIPPPLQVPEVP